MNYHTEDAIDLWQRIQNSIRLRGHERTFESLEETDAELMRLTLTLAAASTITAK